jgi:hypothetical protein
MNKLIATRLDGAELYVTQKTKQGYLIGYLKLPDGTKSHETYIDSLTKFGKFQEVKGK